MACPQSEKDLTLSQEEEDAVHDTWGLVSKDLKGNGVKFFLHFFNSYPEYQRKFRGFADVPLFQLAHNRRLKAHAFTVFNAINGMVDNLDDPDVLNELLLKSGENHAKRGLKPSDFTNIKESILEFMEHELGELYTPAAAVGWNKVLSIMVNKISEGLQQPQESS